MMNFCILPPDRLPAVAASPAATTLNVSITPRATRRSSGKRTKPCAAKSPSVPVSSAFSVSDNSATALRPNRSSGTAARPARRRAAAPFRPTGTPASVTSSARGASRSPVSAASNAFCPLPATPAMPRISPPRSMNDTARNAVPNGSSAGRLSPSATSTAAPGALCTRGGVAASARPIIISAMCDGDVVRGLHCATTRPARSTVASSHNA